MTHIFTSNGLLIHANCQDYVIFFFAYCIRKSEVFAWDRNSYFNHIISPMGRIKEKRKFSREFSLH